MFTSNSPFYSSITVIRYLFSGRRTWKILQKQYVSRFVIHLLCSSLRLFGISFHSVLLLCSYTCSIRKSLAASNDLRLLVHTTEQSRHVSDYCPHWFCDLVLSLLLGEFSYHGFYSCVATFPHSVRRRPWLASSSQYLQARLENI